VSPAMANELIKVLSLPSEPDPDIPLVILGARDNYYSECVPHVT
jgi:hypothetical protein